MPASPVRVLVVEDHPQFRRFLILALQSRPELQIASEADDGAEAVRKAHEFQPGLILLDIGLPTLNGIEAAKQIRNLSPHSKILFVSQESSPEMVEAALQTGAQGYVLKIDAGVDLIAAIDAAIQGKRYLSRSVARNGSMSSLMQVSAERVEASATLSPNGAHRHEVGFYSDDRSLMDGYTAFVGTSLRNGKAAIFVGSEAHCEKLLLRLQAYGLDMTAAIEQGRYVALNNSETVAEFTINGMPDRVLFAKAADGLLAKAAESVSGDRTRIVACGEIAPLLWERGDLEAALRVEELWDGVAQANGIQIFCGYSLARFHGQDGSRAFERICDLHSDVLPVDASLIRQ